MEVGRKRSDVDLQNDETISVEAVTPLIKRTFCHVDETRKCNECLRDTSAAQHLLLEGAGGWFHDGCEEAGHLESDVMDV